MTPFKVLVSCVLLAALAACADEADPRLDATDDVEQCRKQLARIYDGLLEYEKREHHPPPGSGAAFLGALLDSGVWPRTEATARALSCPGVDPAKLCADSNSAKAFTPPRGACTAYAARDQSRAPLAQFPTSGTEALVACDNELGPNHARHTNVLCADGSIVTLDLEKLKADGVLPPTADRVPIGPDAPAELLGGALRALTRD
ncbi:MAG: hypothetical protein EPO68_09535 [Planctomycetota bacterium]|nr:MAG: hypothetical protein EPO68_09535 [Planctomycetota bacterium]